MDRVVGELKRRALALRTTPLLRVMENLPRVAREVATRTGKRIEVTLAGAELELDRSILDRLYDPLVHVVRNAVDHGLEAPEARKQAGKSEVGESAHRGDAREGRHPHRGQRRRRRHESRRAARALGRGRTRPRDARRRSPARGDRRDGLPSGSLDGRRASRTSPVAASGWTRCARRSSRSAVRCGWRRARAPAPPRCCAFRSRRRCSACCWSCSAARRSPCRSRRWSASWRLDPGAIEGSAGECFALIDDEPVLVLDLARATRLARRNEQRGAARDRRAAR